MSVPDLFIAGVRRCGTTSLFRWLADHPDVCASSTKETAYLMDPDSPNFRSEANWHDHGPAGYRQFFAHCHGQAHRLEATTRYIHQRTARSVLAGQDPQPHIIIMLRDPTERIYSVYRYAINNRGTLLPDTSFAQFVNAIRQGRPQELFQFSTDDPAGREMAGEMALIQEEIDYGRYVEVLRLWREAIEPGKLHVYLLEDMRLDASRFMTRLCREVELDPSPFMEQRLEPQNQSVLISARRLHRITRNLAPKVPRNAVTRGLYKVYLSLQHKQRPNSRDEDDSMLAQLCEYYKPFNRALGAEFDLDLSSWADAAIQFPKKLSRPAGPRAGT